MHPTIGYPLASALIAEDHARAERKRAAQASIEARRTAQRGHRHPAPRRNIAALTRHALTALGTRST
jgi:hypothetical protein